MITYEVIENEFGQQLLKNDNGVLSWVPMDEGNADYQRYLNPDLENGTISQDNNLKQRGQYDRKVRYSCYRLVR